MKLEDQRILFIMRSTQHGGTENVVLQLCEIFHDQVNQIFVAGGNGFHKEKLEPYQIPFIDIPDLEDKRPRNMICIIERLRSVIRKHRITVVHTHHRMAAFYCQLLCLNKHIRLINTSHTAFYDKKVLTHIAFRRFHLIACGEGVKKSLTKGLGFSPERITVICNGVKKKTYLDSSMIEEIQHARMNGNHVFAVIGRLSEEKGIQYLIRASALLNNHNVVCIVVGSGPEEDKLRALVRDNHLEGVFVFLGYRQDITNIISQVDFVVLPSLQEGLPLVPIEAFAMGKTVIGTNIDGTAEIIENGRNGLLVPAADEQALARAIDQMCSMDRSDFEKNARETFDRRYDFRQFAASYIEFYEKLP